MTAKDTVFPNYRQMSQHIPQPVWWALRLLTIGASLLLIGVAFIAPQTALFVFWHLIVPLLPIIFFVVPGLWRNVCPMAALNQLPRRFHFSRALTPPAWWRKSAYLIGVTL